MGGMAFGCHGFTRGSATPVVSVAMTLLELEMTCDGIVLQYMILHEPIGKDDVRIRPCPYKVMHVM